MATDQRGSCDFVTTVIVIFALCGYLCATALNDTQLNRNPKTGVIKWRKDNLNIKSGNFNRTISPTRRGRRNLKDSICKTEIGCSCTSKNYFLQVECNFTKNQHYSFGTKNYIPQMANSFTVRLAPRADLTIDSNFFSNTRLNRISIEGIVSEKTSLRIEFRANASIGMLGPNPEFEIRNCHTLILGANSMLGDVKFNISNCRVVHIFENAFHSTSFNGQIEDVDDLRIRENAFNNGTGNLSIYRSNIENLYGLKATFRRIAFYNCRIENITTKTFDVLQIGAIVFDNCNITSVNTNAITEKLQSQDLKITGSYIGLIESEAIRGSGIREIIISNNGIDTIQSKAIQVTSVNAAITNNRIVHAGDQWIHINDWTNINVSNNSFGEFSSMFLTNNTKPEISCIFEKNLITIAHPGSLNFTDKRCSIREISFDRDCSCLKYDNWLEKLSTLDLRSESYCKINGLLTRCFNRTLIGVLRFENEVCSEISDTLDCMKQNNLEFIDGKFINRSELEPKDNRLLYFIIIAIIAIVVIVLIVVVAMACARRRKRINVRTRTLDEVRRHSAANQNLFSREDQRIIDQTLEIVRLNYPSGTYEELCRQVKDLTKPNISETELVQTIGAIVYILNSCENSGDNFVAFTAILGKLLQPAHETNLDPVYAEPQQMGLRPYNTAGQQTEIEHIYNEPNNVQTPLLTNEYALPADKNDAPPVYTEPIRNDADLINPYSISGKCHDNIAPPIINHPLLQPGTSHRASRNLPDVLSSSNSNHEKTNVQRIAENFANNPNFHITRSPVTNRRIPPYAIPISTGRSKMSELPHSSASSQAETGSNHSGGSDVTVKIDDIDYADA